MAGVCGVTDVATAADEELRLLLKQIGRNSSVREGLSEDLRRREEVILAELERRK